jgi:ribosomal-protein-alanine N-acetyltransferase
MEIFAETDRLLLREILEEDEQALFELDSDPEVHRYLGNQPVKSIEQIRLVIAFIRQQYEDNGIGRWAVIEKSSEQFVGWAGLKLFRERVNGRDNFYELGYRFMKKHWGKGFATESARASVNYGFSTLKQKELFAMTDVNNAVSKKVLQKTGFTYVETFNFNEEPTDWFSISKK